MDETSTNVAIAFEKLHVDSLDPYDGSISRDHRDSIASKLISAARTYDDGQPCAAAVHLDGYLDQLQAVREGTALRAAENLYNRGRSLLADVLATVPGECAGHERAGDEPVVALRESDNRHLTGTVVLGEPRMWTTTAGREQFTQVEVPGVDATDGTVGHPAVPVFRSLVAVPRGATVSVRVTRALPAQTVRLNLFPFQHLPEDQDDPFPPPEAFADQAFTKDDRAYATNATFPPGPVCSIVHLGQSRDLPMAQLSCAAATYNPVTDAMTFYAGIDLEVSFTGGSGAFLTEAALSPFDSGSASAMRSVVNQTTITGFVERIDRTIRCTGEELLILTHPDFRTAADALRSWKQDKGILTTVFEVNDGAGPGPDTKDTIDQFIDHRFDSCSVRPSYVLLLGDAEFVPTFHIQWLDKAAGRMIGTDYPYAQHPGLADWPPDFAVARMPVDTPQQATAVVTKVIDYEQSPPDVPAFYEQATVASQFQCCAVGTVDGTDQRAFVRTSERLRTSMLTDGVGAVDRIYGVTIDRTGNPNTSPPVPPYCTIPAPLCGRDTTPRFHRNGSALPFALGPGYAWDGSGADVASAIENGRFLVVHIDHGGKTGWGTPGFRSSHVDALTNGELLPVVFSMNCSTGYFDGETDPELVMPGTAVGFTEKLLRRGTGGAVGVISSSRNSNTGFNDVLAIGFTDAVWPDTAPAFGGQGRTYRLGDILNHGKLHMLSQYGAGHDNARNHLRLYHAFGDPTQEIWTTNPHELPDLFDSNIHDLGLHIEYAEADAVITAYQDTTDGPLAIGRGTVTAGSAELPFINHPRPDLPILLSASKPGTISRPLTG